MNLENVVLNPLLSLNLAPQENERDTIIMGAPRRGDRLRILQLNPQENPQLHELFSELLETSLNFLDIEADLSDAERELLAENNVLIEPENLPSQPLFACYLDEIAPQQFEESADLIVNPTFRFVRADNFQARFDIRKWNFAADAPLAYVTDAGTKVEFAYVPRNEFIEILSQFAAGEKLERELSQDQINLLRTAQILVTPEQIDTRAAEWQEKIAAASELFEREHYTGLTQILPPAQIAAIRNYLNDLAAEGLMRFDDGQVNLRFGKHNDSLSRYFHEQLAPLVSRAVGQTVKPSYVYSATYIEDAVLKPHTDRPQCEFTMSMQINYEPMPENKVSPWALCLDDKNDQRIEYLLANGDAMIYKGCELVHYRDALAKNHRSTSIFFHYVNEDFEGSLE